MPLHTFATIQPNLYKDSVALMRVAQRLLALPDVVNATLQMGNPANKEILAEAGLLSDAVKGAGPSDIMVVVQARSAAAGTAAMAEARAQLAGHAGQAGSAAQHGHGGGAADDAAHAPIPAHCARMGLAQMEAALSALPPTARSQPGSAGSSVGALHTHIAQISVPGAYAGAEALKALQLGLNVFLFSDNVSLDHEVAIKREAAKRGLLVMGPDCGTALIGGVPLGFANKVRRGGIGVVAASGTGAQEFSTQVHRMGGGISHIIGTGGRDVCAEVGGASMLQGIALLARDAATTVIALISKPPAEGVAQQLLAALQAAGKPAVVLFLGSDVRAPRGAKPAVRVVQTLVDAAAAAMQLARVRPQPAPAYALPRKPRFAKTQKYLRALYSGGTYAAEAQLLWARAGLRVWSNAPIKPTMTNLPIQPTLELPNPRQASREHTALDLGDDAFTVGRPHPMIDQAARIDRLAQEAADPSVRVIVLDVVIGWGAHADPAAELAPAIVHARRSAAQAGRHLAVIGFVCGTELDPQRLAAQEATLRAAGMVLAGNSANAAWLAGEWVK